jgi:hypothetical protein
VDLRVLVIYNIPLLMQVHFKPIGGEILSWALAGFYLSSCCHLFHCRKSFRNASKCTIRSLNIWDLYILYPRFGVTVFHLSMVGTSKRKWQVDSLAEQDTPALVGSHGGEKKRKRSNAGLLKWSKERKPVKKQKKGDVVSEAPLVA